MTRRTPLVALVLAPLLLFALLWFWKLALVPLFHTIWTGDMVVMWRLDSSDAKTREQALLRTPMGEPGPALVARLADLVGNDPAPSVRRAAAGKLGQFGSRAPLPDATREVLIAAVLKAPDAGTRDASIVAVGTSAAHNRYPDEVARHIAKMLVAPGTHSRGPSIEAIGLLGAAQPLPPDVFETVNEAFARGERTGLGEPLAGALAQIAASRPLPAATLDLLAAALRGDRDDALRARALIALAYSAEIYPPAAALIDAAQHDANRDVKDGARNAMRIVQTRQLLGGRMPIEVARDRNAPVPARVRAIELLPLHEADDTLRRQVLTLASDGEAQVAAATLGRLGQMNHSSDAEFDSVQILPALRAAMRRDDAKVRLAAFNALGSMYLSHARYRSVADNFRAELEAGAADSDADVRILAMALLLRHAPGPDAADTIVERALHDADPKVRRSAAGWLAGGPVEFADRQALIDKALADPEDSVRATAADTQKNWASQRSAAWPRRLMQALREGQFGKLGFSALTIVTIGTPILVGGGFLIYCMARLLTYAFQRRWRALVVLPVVAVWAAASYGVFMAFFVAGHMRWTEPWAIAQGAAILWAIIALYAGLGWAMRLPIRR